jgi:hypothetical protein
MNVQISLDCEKNEVNISLNVPEGTKLNFCGTPVELKKRQGKIEKVADFLPPAADNSAEITAVQNQFKREDLREAAFKLTLAQKKEAKKLLQHLTGDPLARIETLPVDLLDKVYNELIQLGEENGRF